MRIIDWSSDVCSSDLTAEDPHYLATLEVTERDLRRGSVMLRYSAPDDFGPPVTAFNICTFWLIEALHRTGRKEEARALFGEMLERRTAAGLLSEDIDPITRSEEHTSELQSLMRNSYA